MNNNYTLETVDIETLYKIMLERQRDGYRLAQICATAFEGYNEVIYSVARDYTLENFKVIVPIEN